MATDIDIKVSYGLGNDFYALFLDPEMNYSSGVWAAGDDLSAAQVRKLDQLAEFAHVEPGARVLDIGCGWGAALRHLVTRSGAAKAHGITLSTDQAKLVAERALPGTSVELVDFRAYEPEQPFDSVVSIEMIEHVATPLELRQGRHIDRYREYFRLAHRWTKPGAHFGLASILRDRIPRDRDDLRELHWATHTIFPGSVTVRMEDVVRSVSPHWEVLAVRTHRADYARTARVWHENLQRREHDVRTSYGDELFAAYSRYLAGCVVAFEKRYQTLAHWSLRRVD